MSVVYKKLEQVCDILDSQRVPITAKNRKAGEYPYYGANGLQDYVDNYIFDDELVLLAEDGGNFGSAERPIAYRVSGKCWVNNHAHVLKARPEMNIDYLCYSLMFYNTNGIINGATRQKLTQAAMRKMVIPYREMSEQIEIVNKISRILSLIEERKKELELLDELVKSRFIELFGDPVLNSKGWEVHRLDEYIEFLTSGSRGWAKYFVDEENEMFITIKNVKNNHISMENVQYINAPENKEAKRTKVKTGDLLISITADLGRTAIVDKKVADRGAYINQHLSLVRLNQSKVSPLFVSYFLETQGGRIQFENKNQSAVKAGLNFEAIKSLKILVPPLGLQESYLKFVAQTDKSKLAVQKSLDELETLKKSLMQEYFG